MHLDRDTDRLKASAEAWSLERYCGGFRTGFDLTPFGEKTSHGFDLRQGIRAIQLPDQLSHPQGVDEFLGTPQRRLPPCMIFLSPLLLY